MYSSSCCASATHCACRVLSLSRFNDMCIQSMYKDTTIGKQQPPNTESQFPSSLHRITPESSPSYSAATVFVSAPIASCTPFSSTFAPISPAPYLHANVRVSVIPLQSARPIPYGRRKEGDNSPSNNRNPHESAQDAKHQRHHPPRREPIR